MSIDFTAIRENDRTILNALAKRYGGELQGDDKYGQMDIQFPTMHDATSFVNQMMWESFTTLTFPDTFRGKNFNQKVTITIHNWGTRIKEFMRND